MRKIFTLLFLSAISSSILLLSCSKGSGGGGTSNQSLKVSLSKNTLRADGFEEVTITVLDQNNTDVTPGSIYTINGLTYTTNKFHTSGPGSYTITATKNGIQSSAATLTATDPGPSPFTQKVFVEDYTGTWCGYCPRVGVQLTNYTATHPKCIVVGVHGPSGSSDPYNYSYVSQLTTAFGITGWPTAVINRDYKWDESNSVLDQEVTKRAPLGVGFETSVAGSTINVKAKVKFDVTTTVPLKLVVLLVEDGLVWAQTNYYAPTYGGNPINNYTHNHVLRAAATDIFGDDIPTAQQVSGTVWEKNLSINASTYNISNCKIVAFVMVPSGVTGYKGTLNAQLVTVGQNKDFD